MTRHIEAWVQGRWVAQAPSVTADEAEAWGWKWRYVGGRSYEVRWTTDEVEKLFSLTSPYSKGFV